MEQKPASPPLNRQIALVVRDEKLSPSKRFSACLVHWGLSDDEAAALLLVSRPVVARIRLNNRRASQELAARIEPLFGIPAMAWAKMTPMTASQIKANRATLERAAKGRKAA
jgi:plasmid maintenance system antidote protein VapI